MSDPTWALDHDAVRHAILDLVGLQAPPIRRQLLEAMVRHPGESVAVKHISPNVGDIYVRDLDGAWHLVGELDFAQYEREAPGDWN